MLILNPLGFLGNQETHIFSEAISFTAACNLPTSRLKII